VLAQLTLAAVLLLGSAAVARSQTASSGGLGAHIDALGSLDYRTRMNAARMIRRAPASEAVAALRAAIRDHADQFVRYRAFVLLTAFNDRETAALVGELLRDRNDRLREAAYKWLEDHPQPVMVGTLLAALQTEHAEFVRPALVGALAALDADPRVQQALVAEVPRGLDFFRSAVIDALGRHRARYAVAAIADVAALQGPLQDDAVLALGRIGGEEAKRALSELATPPRDVALTLRAAECLMGERCAEHVKALAEAASAATSASTLRAATDALAAVAAGGEASAMAALVALGARGGAYRERAAVALAVAAARNPDTTLGWLDRASPGERSQAIEQLREGFELLEEDYAEEQFYAAARATFWRAPEGSATRELMAALIQRLEF
jgi:HEAT repeat protein